jgi:hypothetical protein
MLRRRAIAFWVFGFPSIPLPSLPFLAITNASIMPAFALVERGRDQRR